MRTTGLTTRRRYALDMASGRAIYPQVPPSFAGVVKYLPIRDTSSARLRGPYRPRFIASVRPETLTFSVSIGPAQSLFPNHGDTPGGQWYQ